MKKGILLFINILIINELFAQIGGNRIYEFLTLPSSARVTALGSSAIAIKDDDVALAYMNPAALNPSMHRMLSFNHNIHFAGINNGYVAYGRYSEKINMTFCVGMQYINYGNFITRDEYGQAQGAFSAGEYALSLGAGKQLSDKLSLGANIKGISSQLETYHSVGIATDVAAMYYDSLQRFSATLVFQNFGRPISNYRIGNHETLPADIQFGISKVLAHLPFRFSIIAHHLQQWNLLYTNPNIQSDIIFLGASSTTEKSKLNQFVDNTFRHLIFNGEFLLGNAENFKLRLGYNHFLRKDMSVSNIRSLGTGISFGVGFKIKRFRFEYGRGIYHLAGGTNTFSFGFKL